MLTSVRTLAIQPLAGGAALGEAGPCERVNGVACGELDPRDAINRSIVDLALAPTNARGRVEYEFEWCLLRPCDPARRSGTVLYDVTNRGRKFMLQWLQGAAASEQPTSAAELGDALFLRRGATILWSGWDAAPPERNQGMTLRGPRARGVAGTVRDEWVFGTRDTHGEIAQLAYRAASLDPARARLTVRRREGDARVVIPASDWEYVDERHIRLLGDAFAIGALYEFHYPSADPVVMGIGFAAVRDLGACARHGAPTAAGPIGKGELHTRALLALGISQAGRFLRDFVRGGWNRDESGRKVFDGMLAHIAGAGGVFLNARFAQPVRTATRHADHRFPESRFPFAAAPTRDPASGATGALLRQDGSDPLWMEVNTSTEYWQKGASLIHTDPQGTRDLELPEYARAYLVAGTQHGGALGRGAPAGMCLHPVNRHDPAPLLRALLCALETWVRDGTAPPPSCVPTIAAGTLVDAAALRFPAVPGVTPPAAANPLAAEPDWVHPGGQAAPWRVLVPQVDADGNESGGVRLPGIAVPLATHTGWNFYVAPYASGELADRYGSCLPFAADEAQRQQRGDPRPSVRARYADAKVYVERVRAVVEQLVAARLMLAEDGAAVLAGAAALWEQAVAQ